VEVCSTTDRLQSDSRATGSTTTAILGCRCLNTKRLRQRIYLLGWASYFKYFAFIRRLTGPGRPATARTLRINKRAKSLSRPDAIDDSEAVVYTLLRPYSTGKSFPIGGPLLEVDAI